MKVLLTIFKPEGKYYTSGEYDTQETDLHNIWAEVRGMIICGGLPGLQPGAHYSTAPGEADWTVLVDVPDHQHNHPHLVTYRNPEKVSPKVCRFCGKPIEGEVFHYGKSEVCYECYKKETFIDEECA